MTWVRPTIFTGGNYTIFSGYEEAKTFCQKAKDPIRAQKTLNIVMLLYRKVFDHFDKVFPKEMTDFYKRMERVSFLDQGRELLDKIDEDEDAQKEFIKKFVSIGELYKQIQNELDPKKPKPPETPRSKNEKVTVDQKSQLFQYIDMNEDFQNDRSENKMSI
jgi:hypothetical protein